MIERKTIQVSTFKGFSKPVEKVSLLEKLQEIAEGKHLIAIEKLRQLLRNGKEEEASRVKRQLQSFTLSATYSEKRKAEGITGYNDVLMLDFDKLSNEELRRCREIIAGTPETLFCNTSPSANGLKVGAYYNRGEIERLRAALFSRPEITVAELEDFHKKAFDQCREYYEELCGVKIDPSGSDIGRLCFVSYDPNIYINKQAIEALRLPESTIVALPPAPKQSSAKGVTRHKKIRQEIPGDSTVDLSGISPHIQMEFQRCVNSTRRSKKFEPGGRDLFIYTLGHLCYCKGIPEEVTARLTQHRYGGAPDIDIPQIIANAYQYTSRTDREKEEKKKPVAVRLVEFLGKTIEARRNLVLDQLEIRPKTSESPENPFRLIRKEDYNTMFLDAQFAGIPCHPLIVRTVVNSRFAIDYNPFEDYFYNLPPWDTRTDHIDNLSRTLQTGNQVFWQDCFKRWLVGLVACALDDGKENQLALIIKGEQGTGKSTWIRRLLPPELKHYYRNGMLNPSNKDHMIFLSQRLLINLEEFEGMKKDDISELKRLIGQDAVTERKAYSEEAGFYIRRASFIASTNEPRFLEDITGTRRFPTVTAKKIDYKTPVDHAGIYSQALHLWQSGFRYWYEEQEFQELNANNTQYVITSQEEELFYFYFRKPTPADHVTQWMPVSAILTQLIIHGKIQNNKQTLRTLIKVLERDEFRQRFSKNRIVEYEVVFVYLQELSR